MGQSALLSLGPGLMSAMMRSETMNTIEMQLEIVALQNLIYRMSLMLTEYELGDVDIEAKMLITEADGVADAMCGGGIPQASKYPNLRLVN
jgi:hypothetical protein